MFTVAAGAEGSRCRPGSIATLPSLPSLSSLPLTADHAT